MPLSSMFSPFTFQMGLIIYVGLLLLTSKVLSLLFDSQDITFLSWAHSYASFYNWSNCWVCNLLKASYDGFLHLKEKTFFNNNHV